MKKVYVVMKHHAYEGGWLVGVRGSRETANAFVEEHYGEEYARVRGDLKWGAVDDEGVQEADHPRGTYGVVDWYTVSECEVAE